MVSHNRKRKRFIRDLQIGRFCTQPPVLIDEATLPLPVQDRLARLRAEVGHQKEVIAQRNLDLLECRRELRVLHRFGRQLFKVRGKTMSHCSLHELECLRALDSVPTSLVRQLAEAATNAPVRDVWTVELRRRQAEGIA